MEVILMCIGVGMIGFSFSGVLILALVVEYLYKRVMILEKIIKGELNERNRQTNSRP